MFHPRPTGGQFGARRAQRRMASEDVSLGVFREGQSVRRVLNAGWRLRMFHERQQAQP